MRLGIAGVLVAIVSGGCNAASAPTGASGAGGAIGASGLTDFGTTPPAAGGAHGTSPDAGGFGGLAMTPQLGGAGAGALNAGGMSAGGMMAGDNSGGGVTAAGAPPAGGVAGDAHAGAAGAAPETPWKAFNYSPATRALAPVSATIHGRVTSGAAPVLYGQPSRLNAGAGITFDFGKEVAGLVSLRFGAASDAAQSVSLSFSESSQFVGPASDMSIGPTDAVDGALSARAPAMGSYAMPANKLRGGFRYLSVYLTTGGWLDLTGVSLAFSAAPGMPAPNQYANYFYSNDDLLNRIWYAGAYTVQLNTVDPKQGRAFPYPAAGTNWDNSFTVGVGSSVIVDGAKRDRTVWPGDLGIALATAYVSTGDLLSVKNTLDTLYGGRDTSTGEFPRSGPPLNPQNTHTLSDTYHLWTLIGSGDYYLYSGDKAWLDRNWAAYKQALAFSTAKIDKSGLMQVTLVKDWGRLGQGGANIAANAILYRVLLNSAQMATVLGDAALAKTYSTQAATLKTAANSLLWDSAAGAFRDNLTSTLHPQDGNALATWLGLVDPGAKTQAIGAALRRNWNGFGSRTPEGDPLRATISPFSGSMEVAGRFVAFDDQAALDLIRLEWGYMLNAKIGTASTFWEGYLDDGSFGYGGSYMSAAHGWSSGPTFALTQWVLGVAPDSAAGQAFHVIPHPGDLNHVEGSLALSSGKIVRILYDHPSCGDFSLHVDSSSLAGSVGLVGVPKFGQSPMIQLNGVTVWDGSRAQPANGVGSVDQDTNYVYFHDLSPRDWTFSTYPKRCP